MRFQLNLLFTSLLIAVSISLSLANTEAQDHKTSSTESQPTVSDYNPLNLTADEKKLRSELMVIEDEKRDRKIPVKIYLPPKPEKTDTQNPLPVVIFSHGLGGSRNASPYLGKHWSARGYICVFIQHPGSDETVWKNARLRDRMATLKKAASASNLKLRAGDVSSVINQLEKWNSQEDHKYFGQLDLAKIGMSGHSFGAATTQAVSGQRYFGKPIYLEKRIVASVAFSANAPRKGSREKEFGEIKIPWMSMTGTKDTSPIGRGDVDSRKAVYESLPKGNKYQVVLDGAQHSAFGDGARKRSGKNPNHHKVIKALSTAFWDAYLKKDRDAIEWLASEAPRSVMEAKDDWQTK